MALENTKRKKATIFRSERWREDHSVSVRISTPSASAQVCKIAHTCGSCKYINGAYQASLADKYQLAIAKFKAAGLLDGTSVMDPVPSPRTVGYRAHAKLAVRPMTESARPRIGERFAIGLFQPASQKLVQLDSCPLHRDSINRLLPDLKAELEASDLQPYSETNHTGQIRYIAIRASHLTEELMLTVVATDESPKVALKAMVLRLRQKGHVIVALHLNLNAEQTNTIFGATTKKIIGAEGLRESLCNLVFEIGPTSFFQVNPWQAEVIYRRVEQMAGQASSGEVAWDLNCSTGQISMLLGLQGYKTLAIEENSEAIAVAEVNVRRNELTAEQKPYFISGQVEEIAAALPTWAGRPRCIVANPSKSGLTPAARQMVKQGLDARADGRMVYVSCDAETLIRDLAELVASTGRRVRQLECFDMFPFTEKLEWIAVIQ